MAKRRPSSNKRLTGDDNDFLKIALPACRAGRLEDVKTLCKDPRNFPQWIGPHGRTMLWEAARGGRLEAIEYLDKEYSANTRAIGCYYRESRVELSPWATARLFHHEHVCEYLRRRRAGLDFMAACFFGERDYLARRLKKNQQLANQPVIRRHRWNPYQAWPLQYAIAGRQPEVLSLLLKFIDRHERIDPAVIFDAVATSQEGVVDDLLSAGCQPNFKSQREWLDPSLKKLAEKHGFRIRDSDFENEKWPALVDACRGNHNAADDIGRVLPILEQGADIQVRDYKGKTALHRAAQAGFVEIARWLIENGAPLDARDETGCTPIFDAAFYGRLDVLQLLIKQGADLEATNSRHENVLFAAIRGGQMSTFSCLIEYPFLLEQTNKKGQTLFELARKLSKTGIVPIRQKLKLMANERNR